MAQKPRPGRQLTNSSALSRERAASHYAQKRKTQKRRSTLQRVLIGVGVAVAALAAVTALYLAYIQTQLQGNVDDSLRNELTATAPRQPFYMVLLGTDKSQEREDAGELGTWRSDTIILARIDATTKHVTLVSIVRDTLVDLGEYGQQKINAAYTLGGPALAVKAVSQLAGVPITHYAEINFDEFVGVVDKLGGVTVDIKIDLEDPMANLSLKAGEQTINGQQALALCRSRHAYDAYGGGDYYRTANQRMVIGAILKKVLNSNPLTLPATVGEMAKSVTTDMPLSKILGLASAFRGFDISKDLYSGLEPTEARYMGGVWYELVKEPDWTDMMNRVSAGLSPYASEDEDFTLDVAGSASAISGQEGSTSSSSSAQTAQGGNVLVMNGTGVGGLAGRVAQTLKQAGYTCEAVNAQRTGYNSSFVLYVGDKNKDLADQVAELLGLSNIQADDGSHGYIEKPDIDPQVIVVLGADMASAA